MPLAVGARLGNFELVGQLGAGGMGEVYRAKDTKLDREVAIKVLPAAYAQHPERLARFEREAKVLASLNHPNIATIYAVEESPDGKALVMELVKGQTLKGPVPLDAALKYAAQIASALDAAHEKGITHRDLKPANIMVTPDGTIKVLDFGLAAVTQPSQSDGEIGTNMATLTMSPTSAGMIMGTAAYMSPEQASGQTVDRRADIWAFGVVLWELLTGKQLFEGTTVSHILAAVLTKEPDYTQVPFKVRRLLRRCLEKDPQKRLVHIGDVMELVEGDSEAAPVAATTRSQSRLGRVAWATASLTTLAAFALGFLAYRHVSEEPPRVLKMSVLPPDNAALSNTLPAVSPDGHRVAFVATVDRQARLWVRDLDSLVARLLPGTQDASFPFWSPDGRFLGFFAEGKLKKIDLAGGPALTLCEAPDGRGGSWNQNDVILFAPAISTSGLSRVSAEGGASVRVTELDAKAGEISHRFPWFLPDGRHFLFQNRTSDRSLIAVYFGDLESGTWHRVVAASSNVAYVPPGYILYTREQTLLAQPFDAAKGEIRGDPVAIAEPVDYESLDTRGEFSVSRNGVLVYLSGGGGGDSELTWLDRHGKPLGTMGPPSDVLWPAISPDGKTVAVEHFARLTDRDIWLHDVTRGGGSRFTFTGTGRFPIWSPDGRQLAYRFLRNGINYLARKGASGAPQEQILFQGARPMRPVDWSHDGRFLIAQMDIDPKLKTRNDIWVIPLAGDQKPYPYLQSEFAERRAKLSPSGRWMAYVSDESKRNEIYVQEFPNPAEKWPVSTNGGDYPIWSRDGTELYFIAGDQKLMAVEVKSGARFEAGVPKPLFDTHLGNLLGDQWFDVTADGRFLIPTVIEQSAVVPLTVVVNWTAGLKK